MKTTLLCASLFSVIALATSQDELEISAEEFPRVPATEPSDTLSNFEIEPGFKLSLAAHEPDVMDPIAMAFDEQGRAYVLEMRGYSERREEALGRVKLLTDTDGDGVFDKSTIFKDGLKWPTGIACYKGGVFVGATPDVFYFRDSDGDGVCDEEKTVFTGFGEGPPRLNMQALFNSFRWGPDNRIWGATAGNGGIVTKVGDPTFEPLKLRGADFSFDPEKLDLRPENGTAQYGLSFDSKGRRFVCSNSRHIQWVAYERHDVTPNPWYSLPAPLVDIPDDGAAAPVYRISPDEPWRIVRTRWRVAGVVKGSVEGGGRVSGYFTAATGVHLFWGDAFGESFRDNAFIGDAGSNLVHRKIVERKKSSEDLVAFRPDPDEKTEFLRSTDNWFRPSSFATGPNGCLYVCDMYRETIEHPWSIPEPIKKHVDLNSGNDRGRIYLVSPAGFQQPAIPDLATLDNGELTALLNHPNDWHRTTARRLLYERGEPAPPVPSVEPFPAALNAEKPRFDLLNRVEGNSWMQAAMLNSLRTPEDLWKAYDTATSLNIHSPAPDIAKMIGRSGDEALIERVAKQLASEELSVDLLNQLKALQEGMVRSKADWKTLASSDRWDPLVAQARKVMPSSLQQASKTIPAAELLILFPRPGTEELFGSTLIKHGCPPQLATTIAAGMKDVTFLVDHFTTLPDATKAIAASRILANANTSEQFMNAIIEEKLTLAEVPASLIDGLRNHKVDKVKSLAQQGLPPVVLRADVVTQYQPALAGEGDRERGRVAFMKACLVCHESHEGEGIALGPPIATVATAGKDSLLGNILDPNKEVAPQFQAYSFEFHNGPPAVGIILSENANETTVRMPGGIEKTFPRSAVASMKGLGQSLMPEGLENTLSVQEMTDLLVYLTSPKSE